MTELWPIALAVLVGVGLIVALKSLGFSGG